MSDLKIKTAAGKAPLELIPAIAELGKARVYQYGAKKYAPGNFLKATLADGAGGRYVGAARRHLGAMQNPDGTWSRESLAALDEESGLPHIDHAICSLEMLRAVLVKENVLPADPGVGKEPPTVKAGSVLSVFKIEDTFVQPPVNVDIVPQFCGCGYCSRR